MDVLSKDFLLPVVMLFAGAIVTHGAWLLRRKRERASEKDALDIKGKQLDNQAKELDLRTKNLQYQQLLDQNNQPETATAEIRDQIDKTFPEPPQQSTTSLAYSSVTCMVFAEHGTGRAECISDRLGDIVLNFSGGDQRRVATVYNVTLSLNMPCTNRIDDDNSVDVYWVNPADGLTRKKGILEGNKRIVFRDVSIGEPGPVQIFQCKIQNVRVNMTQLGVPTTRAFPATRIYAFVSIEPVTSTERRVAIANHMVDLSTPILACIEVGGNSYTYFPSEQGALHEDLLNVAQPAIEKIPLYYSLREGFAGAFRTSEEEGAAFSKDVTNGTSVVRHTL